MYLKSLEIQGFKSFPDRISLTFDKGLTAVVGPNGSGKSNIGDSVRWVLGEQSTKTLRGNKMEDVIFSGSSARKPMGFAAVTLNIDNSDRTLSDMEDEVSVTRKLYRSGESEYLINGRQVRLKDINELFMDTGLGRDGYSIIGQGRIAEIVGAKSSERRDIFEEAAGISKFRYKKLEAERKLSSAQENILRLNDILSELEGRVEPLRIQSQKAEKFIKLAEEKKKLEISVWVSRLDEFRKKIEAVDAKILVAKNEYENTDNDINSQEQRLDDSYRKMQECTVRMEQLRQKMLEEEQSASDMKSQIAVLENDIQHCEAAVNAAKVSISACDDKKKELGVLINASEKKTSSLEAEKASSEKEAAGISELFEQAERDSSELGSHVDKTGGEINALYIRQSELRMKCASAEEQLEEEKKRLEELSQTSISFEKTMAEHNGQLEECDRKLADNEENTVQLRNRLSGFERLYGSRKESFEQTKTELEKVLYTYREKQQRRKILADLENSMEGFAGSVKQVLKASRQGRLTGVCGTVAQNIGVDKEYALAVETALGGAMQNIIVENEDIAKRCIRFLKEQNAGRATFLPITSVRGNELREQGLDRFPGFVSVASGIVKYEPRFSGIVASLLGRTVIAEDIDSAAAIAKSYGYRFRIVTLDGQVINSGGSFTGGSAQRSAGVITRKNEIDTLEAEMKSLGEEREKLSAKAEKLRAETEKLRIDLENTKKGSAECETEKIRLQAERAGLVSLIGQMNAQSENSGKLTADALEKINSSKAVIDLAEKEMAELTLKITQAEEKLAESQSSREALRLRRAELSEKLSQAKLKVLALEKDIQSQHSETERLLQSIQSADDSIKGYKEEIVRQEDMISGKKNDIEAVRKKLSSLSDNSAGYTEDIDRCQQMHNEYSRIVKEIQLGLRELNEAREKCTSEITRLESQRETVSASSDSIINQLLEVYELTRSEAIALAETIDDMEEAQRELRELKKKISALGNVNVGAIEEYKEVSERYTFMSAQLSDVQKSKAELEKIIADLTDEMCRIFRESFAIINQNFKNIFVDLFGGGKAELILTDPENVLESGIEISVAPPGKVIKNLISLSGGEQSFIAIAIYFAILRLRPSPFCILDEIDAALDEVNVRRYAQYLKNFTDTTQFVLVTHRRSAMEEANVLYGVTMQEDGISKLLRMEQVDFQEDTADVN